MGSSTGSMFYAFGAFLILYLVGASIYQIFLWIRKWREKKENEIDKIAKAKVRKPKKVTPGYKKKMKFEMDKVKRQERRKRK